MWRRATTRSVRALTIARNGVARDRRPDTSGGKKPPWKNPLVLAAAARRLVAGAAGCLGDRPRQGRQTGRQGRSARRGLGQIKTEQEGKKKTTKADEIKQANDNSPFKVGSGTPAPTPPKAKSPAPPKTTTTPANEPYVPWPFDPKDGREYVWSEPENLGPNVNSDKFQQHAVVSADGLCLIFQLGDNSRGSDCMNVGARTLMSLGTGGGAEKINTGHFDNQPGLSADGLTPSAVVWEAAVGSIRWGGPISGKVAELTRRSLDARALGAISTPQATSSSPGCRLTAPTLVFSSVREGQGEGLGDLRSLPCKALDTPWKKPVNLGPVVNTKANESCSQPLADGKSLLLQRDKTLWLAEAAADGKFTARQMAVPATTSSRSGSWPTDARCCSIAVAPAAWEQPISGCPAVC